MRKFFEFVLVVVAVTGSFLGLGYVLNIYPVFTAVPSWKMMVHGFVMMGIGCVAFSISGFSHSRSKYAIVDFLFNVLLFSLVVAIFLALSYRLELEVILKKIALWKVVVIGVTEIVIGGVVTWLLNLEFGSKKVSIG